MNETDKAARETADTDNKQQHQAQQSTTKHYRRHNNYCTIVQETNQPRCAYASNHLQAA